MSGNATHDPLDQAERAAWSTSGGRSQSETSFLQELLRELGGPVSVFELSPADLFRSIVSNRTFKQKVRDALQILALPLQRPEVAIRAGDWMLHFVPGTGDVGHVSILASDELLTQSQLASEGIAAESVQPGLYALVIEAGVFPHSRASPFARRVLDSRGCVLRHRVIVRPNHSPMGFMADFPPDDPDAETAPTEETERDAADRDNLEPEVSEACEEELESSTAEYAPDLGAPETGDPRRKPEEVGRTDLDRHFEGRAGEDLKTLFRDVALTLQLDPGLLAAVVFAEKHAGTPLLSTGGVGLSLEAHTGADDWFIPHRKRLIERVLTDFGGDFTYNDKKVTFKYDDVKKTGATWRNEMNVTKDRGQIPKIPAVTGSGKISSIVIVVALYLKSCEVFLKDVLHAIRQSAAKDQAYTARSYRDKRGRLRRLLTQDEVKKFQFITFDDLPAEYRFVLLRVAYNHGLGGATDLLFKLGKGGDIKRTGGTQRNTKDAERTAVLHAARAFHLSQAVFGTSAFVLEFGHFLEKGKR